MTELRHLRVARPWGWLSVWVYGTGATTVLAVHGLAGSGRYWEGLHRALGPEFTVVAPDLAGFGASDKPRDHAYSRAEHVADLEAVLTKVVPGAHVAVAGHSMGGILAGLLTARCHDRVARLALVASPFPHGRGLPPRLQRTRDRDLRPGRRVIRGAVVGLWPALSLAVRSRVYPRAVVADYVKHTPQSYWATAASVIWNTDAGTELEGLRAFTRPALLLFSDEDGTIGPESERGWASVLTAAERRTAPGGHQLLLRTHFTPLARWLTSTARAG